MPVAALGISTALLKLLLLAVLRNRASTALPAGPTHTEGPRYPCRAARLARRSVGVAMVLSFVKLPYTSAQALLRYTDDFIHPVHCSLPSAKRDVTEQEPGPCTQETFSYGRAGTVAACRNQAPGM